MTLMIERIYIHNYKCLVNFDLQIRKPTVLLLGANGVGKTAVLDVMFGLRKLLAGDAKVTDRVAFHPSTLTRWQSGLEQVFMLEAKVGNDSFTYRLEIEHLGQGRLARIAKETLTGNGTTLFSCELGKVSLYHDDGSEGPKYLVDWSESALARVVEHRDNTRLTSFMRFIEDLVVCTILPSGVRPETTDEDRHLDRYAGNFVGWYRHALQENPISIGSHVGALRDVVDGFQNIQLKQSGLDSRALMFDFIHKSTREGHRAGRYKLRLDELSDGQVALVVLYALLHLKQDRGGIVLFLDEPDNYVELREIQPWLMELADLCDDTPSQAIICSHHPELIDYLGPDGGLVLHRETSSATTARPLVLPASEMRLRLSEWVARGWVE